MRFDHCGLYSFCNYLGHALAKRQEEIRGGLGFYVPQDYIGHFGDYPYYKRLPLHKYWLWPRDVTLWHSTYQLTHFMPHGVSVLQTVHDLNFLHEDVSASKRGDYCRRIERHLQKAVAIVAISAFTRDELLQHIRVPAIPVHVIYNGCNHYNGHFSKPACVCQRPFLFSVGTLLPKKNFHVLPPLLAVSDYDLYIAGRDYGYAARILEEARRWGVEGRLHLMGAISEAEKHWMLKHCAAFLFPSLAEGFGLPVLEAMQYGKPVFLSTHTSLPEIGGKQAYYFNSEFDCCAMQEEFIAGMGHYTSHPQQSLLLREHADKFSWDEAALEYIRLYNTYAIE